MAEEKTTKISIEITDNYKKGTIQGTKGDIIFLLTDYFLSVPEARNLFQTALDMAKIVDSSNEKEK